MRHHRFYFPDTTFPEQLDIHDEAILHQWVKVLRIAAGDEVILFDGKGKEALYQIIDLSKHNASVVRVRMLDPLSPPKPLALLWALLKKDKNEWVLQKGVELGVTHFVPMITERTEKTGFPLERAQKIVIEAVEQSGRGDIPNIKDPRVIYEVIQEMREDWMIVALDQEGGSFADLCKTSEKPVAILVGPEGGWSPRERTMFKMEKYPIVTLGKHTLRAETAAIIGPAVARLAEGDA